MIKQTLQYLLILGICAVVAGISGRYYLFLQDLKSTTQAQKETAQAILAETDQIEDFLITFNYDSLFVRPVTFESDITAPNVIYSVNPGEGITISGDPQNPIISTDAVLEIEGLKGSIDLVSGSNVSISTSDDGKITISSVDTDTDTKLSEKEVEDYVLDGESIGWFTDLQVGDVLLSATGSSAVTSGASLVGIYNGAFSTLVGTDLQSVLDSIDQQIFSGGRTFGSGLTDTGTEVKLGGEITENTRLYDGSYEYLFF